MSLADVTSNLRAPVETATDSKPMVKVHAVEWAKIMAGEPVEINPSVGHGYKIMSVKEWAARWKQNEAYPECLVCGSHNTKEHHFTQTWCRGKKKWESETVCLDCHSFSKRSYSDPDFKTPEEYDKDRWQELVASNAGTAIKA
ncbi:hypothetical protein QBZ16_002141 [Prototheca wickerhamii]|uniref:Uncharacterized protein n=1 Tax=Prototheca wickerhamii TaxID=3111 RepID=A0AAD9IJU1_PROWI|nr:hypothetical protein QBZ16_002141 [Prototheca wickerhamii]